MANSGESGQIMVKGTEIEAYTDEKGFEGAWLDAVLLEDTTVSGLERIQVRYTRLLCEDRVTPLVETIEQRLIRPVPNKEDYQNVVIEEDVVVDADHTDCWWTGVVVKQMENDEFLVHFDEPPDVMKFQKKQLRAHIDWVQGKWSLPEKKENAIAKVPTKLIKKWLPKSQVSSKKSSSVAKSNTPIRATKRRSNTPKRATKRRSFSSERSSKTPTECETVDTTQGSNSEKTFEPIANQNVSGTPLIQKDKVLSNSMFSVGTVVEVRSAAEEAWSTAEVVKETEVDGEKKYLVRDLTALVKDFTPDTLVDACRLRPTPPRFTVQTFSVSETVEALCESKWRPGVVRGLLFDNSYTVSVKGTKEDAVFAHSCLRPLRVWDDGVWRDGPERNIIENDCLDSRKRGKTVMGCETVDNTEGPKKIDTLINDQTPLDTTSAEENEAVPSPVAATQSKQTEIETQGKNTEKPTLNPTTGGQVDTLMNDQTPLDTTSHLTSTENEAVPPLTPSPVAATQLKQTEVETQGKNTEKPTMDPVLGHNANRKRNRQAQVDLGDSESSSAATHAEGSQAKGSPVVLPFAKKSPYWKRSEGFKLVPHFSPLISPVIEADNYSRDWMAVGMMVTYYTSLDEVKDLKPDDPPCKLNRLMDSFGKLEKYGFDSAIPRERISKVVSLQDKRAKKAEEKKCWESKIEKEENEEAELNNKILQLQRMKEAAAKRIQEMKVSQSTVSQELQDVETELENTISASF